MDAPGTRCYSIALVLGKDGGPRVAAIRGLDNLGHVAGHVATQLGQRRTLKGTGEVAVLVLEDRLAAGVAGRLGGLVRVLNHKRRLVHRRGRRRRRRRGRGPLTGGHVPGRRAGKRAIARLGEECVDRVALEGRAAVARHGGTLLAAKRARQAKLLARVVVGKRMHALRHAAAARGPPGRAAVVRVQLAKDARHNDILQHAWWRGEKPVTRLSSDNARRR